MRRASSRHLARRARQWGIAVPDEELVETQDAALQDVVAGDQRVGFHRRRGHRLDDLGRQLIAEVAGGLRLRIAAQAIVGRLVQDQRVVDEHELPQVALQPVAEAGGRPTALVSVPVVQVGEQRRLVQALLGAVDLEVNSMVEVTSSNKRVKALEPVTSFSFRMRSSGSVSR